MAKSTQLGSTFGTRFIGYFSSPSGTYIPRIKVNIPFNVQEVRSFLERRL